MKPIQHAKISVHKHGGTLEDYLDIHLWFDQTKSHHASMKHRALLHNSFGIFLCSQTFGEYRTNSVGRQYSVRDIAEEHIMDDLGWIPSLDQVIGLLETDKTLSMFGGKQQVKKLEKFGHVD
jgi:hypothetical protein